MAWHPPLGTFRRTNQLAQDFVTGDRGQGTLRAQILTGRPPCFFVSHGAVRHGAKNHFKLFRANPLRETQRGSTRVRHETVRHRRAEQMPLLESLGLPP